MKRCGILGKNINYTKSPHIHNEYYLKVNIPLNYEIFDLNENQLPEFLKHLQKENIIGFNVTIPYKQLIIKYLSKLHYPADIIGAVNTVVVSNFGLEGYNTDYYGFIKSIEEMNLDLKGSYALILGSGGSAKSIYCALKTLQCANIDLAVRDVESIDKQFFQCKNTYSMQHQNDYSKYDIIINCTPVGGANDANSTPISTETIRSNSVVYDLNYNPEKTRLLMDAEKKGAKIINGESMLINQALAAADIWINEFMGGK